MKKHKILLIDDEKLIREQLEEALIDEGYDVELATNGTDGWERFQKGHHPIVVTDLRMPKSLDGLKVLENIKKQKLSTEVIIITGHGGKYDAIQCLNLEALRYVEKGGSDMLDNLLNAIKLAIERYDQGNRELDLTTLLDELNVKRPVLPIEEVRKRIKELGLPPLSEILIKERRGDHD